MEDISRRKLMLATAGTLFVTACRTPEKGLKPSEVTPPSRISTPRPEITPSQPLEPFTASFTNESTTHTGILNVTFVNGIFRVHPLIQVNRKDPVSNFRINQKYIALSGDAVQIDTVLFNGNNLLDEFPMNPYRFGFGNILDTQTHWKNGKIIRLVLNGTAYEIR